MFIIEYTGGKGGEAKIFSFCESLAGPDDLPSSAKLKLRS